MSRGKLSYDPKVSSCGDEAGAKRWVFPLMCASTVDGGNCVVCCSSRPRPPRGGADEGIVVAIAHCMGLTAFKPWSDADHHFSTTTIPSPPSPGAPSVLASRVGRRMFTIRLPCGISRGAILAKTKPLGHRGDGGGSFVKETKCCWGVMVGMHY